ncbi:MAG: hypothetical protein DMG73_19290 [Acidobacteria bacterium]|nr:MAG: hypothetical protein DMG73_19290 [Acidobacteriota bacterium]PYX64180.1 MAG: hypothetical protein DMG74_14060 [Acidobacteriota bacterium]
MSESLLIIIVVSIGAVGFFVRVLIALCKESGSARICQVLKLGSHRHELSSVGTDWHGIRLGKANSNGINGRRAHGIDEAGNGQIVPRSRGREAV